MGYAERESDIDRKVCFRSVSDANSNSETLKPQLRLLNR